MSTFFVDTSALAKRYVTEIGSTWIRSLLRPSARHVVIISALTTVELPSLLARLVREGALPAVSASQLETHFLGHATHEYLVVSVDRPTLTEARQLVHAHPLRTLDALQLASARLASITLSEPLTFLGSDRALLAAHAVGLATDDPLLHP